jgi:nitrite reductase (NO-forming)/hydroxylamine reductase
MVTRTRAFPGAALLLLAAACAAPTPLAPDSGSGGGGGTTDAGGLAVGDATRGEAIFRGACASCHGLGQAGERRAPDLRDVTTRRPQRWLEHWLDNPPQVAQENPYAKQLVTQWGNVVMPDPGLDAAGIADVIAYLKTQPTLTPTPPVALTDETRAAMRQLYFDRCAGCHGTLRVGGTGPSLSEARSTELGTDTLTATLRNGRPWGMPAWGREGLISEAELAQLAAFLQEPPPAPPALSLADAKASWSVLVPVADRPTAPAHQRDWQNFFGVILRDSGKVAILDGTTREEVARIDTGFAVHILRASSSGRYLTAIGRDGWLTLIDLWSTVPTAVAKARGCYDARSVESSKHPGYEDRYAIQGCYWPPQYVVFDGLTLEPLAVESVLSAPLGGTEPLAEVRVAAIVAVPGATQWALALKESGYVALVDYAQPGFPVVSRIAAARFLHDGGLDRTGRYLLLAANAMNRMVVVDLQQRALVTTLETGLLPHPGRGANWEDPVHGWVNATTHLGEARLSVYGADPAGRPENAWKVLRQVETPSSGSLFLKTHPNSPWVLFDVALATDAPTSRKLCAYAKATGALDRCFEVSTTGPALQPEFNRDGTEVWVSVWHERGELVVYDAVTLEEKARLPGFATPTGKFNVFNTAHDVY